MKEILIPLNFTTTPAVYDTKQSFSTSDEASGVLTFTTTADVAGTVASLTIRNASENANRQTILIERLDVNSSPFSYALKNPLPFGQYEGTILLKKNLTVIASASFLFGVNSRLSAEVLPDLVKAYSLDELVENVETEVSNLKDAFNLTVSETVKGVNKTESSLQAQENVRYLNEHQRKANELERIVNENARIAAEVERKDTFDTLVESEVIEQTVVQEVANEFQQIEATYANRLLSTEQQLADKVGGGKLAAMTDLGQDVKEAMTGGSVAVVGDNAVIESNIVDKQVTERKTSFFNVSKNLFNKDTITLNKFISEDGVVSENNYYFYTDFIKVSRTQPLAMTNSKFTLGSGFNHLVEYDSNKNFISRRVLPTTQDYFSDFNSITKYVRFNGLKAESNNFQLMVNEGETLLPYKAHYAPYLKSSAIGDGSITTSHTTFFTVSKNLHNKDSDILDKAILADGTISDNTSYLCTDFIEIDPTQPISVTNQKYILDYGFNHIAQYDENKNFIYRSTLSLTSNTYSGYNKRTRYVRLNAEKKYALGFDLIVNIGNQLFEYEPYGVYIRKEYLKDIEIPDFSDVDVESTALQVFKTRELDKKKQFIVDSILPVGSYSAKNDTLLKSTLEGISYTDVYQFFDGLTSQHSDYITKTVLGADSSGVRDVNMYRLKPQTVSATYSTLPKLVLSFCIHGSEKPALLAMMNIVNKLCKEYNSDPILKFLRWNVDIVLVPIANPTGYNKNGRTNANNVDINRNFNYKWEAYVGTDKGTAPHSEIETQYLSNLLNNHKDAIAYLDFHTYGATENTWAKRTKMQTADGSDRRLWTKVGAYVIRENTISGWENYGVSIDSGFLGEMGLTDTNSGLGINYAENVLNIPSFAPEATYKFIDGMMYTEQVNKFNVEFVVNSLVETTRNFIG